MKTPFEAWYERSGKHIDPLLTREEFATAAFEDGFQIGMAQSRNPSPMAASCELLTTKLRVCIMECFWRLNNAR